MIVASILPKLVGQRVKRREDPRLIQGRGTYGDDGAHSRFPGHALTPTGVMAIRCKQFHLPDL